jgi:hypothetical protein
VTDTGLVVAGILLVLLALRWTIAAWLIKRDRLRKEMRRHLDAKEKDASAS